MAHDAQSIMGQLIGSAIGSELQQMQLHEQSQFEGAGHPNMHTHAQLSKPC